MTNKQSWEKEFDKKFTDKIDWIETEKVNERGYTYICPVRPKEVKDFISQLLTSKSEQIERELKEEMLNWEIEFDKIRNDGEHCSIDDGALYYLDIVMLKDIFRNILKVEKEKLLDELRNN